MATRRYRDTLTGVLCKRPCQGSEQVRPYRVKTSADSSGLSSGYSGLSLSDGHVELRSDERLDPSPDYTGRIFDEFCPKYAPAYDIECFDADLDLPTIYEPVLDEYFSKRDLQLLRSTSNKAVGPGIECLAAGESYPSKFSGLEFGSR